MFFEKTLQKNGSDVLWGIPAFFWQLSWYRIIACWMQNWNTDLKYFHKDIKFLLNPLYLSVVVYIWMEHFGDESKSWRVKGVVGWKSHERPKVAPFVQRFRWSENWHVPTVIICHTFLVWYFELSKLDFLIILIANELWFSSYTYME